MSREAVWEMVQGLQAGLQARERQLERQGQQLAAMQEVQHQLQVAPLMHQLADSIMIHLKFMDNLYSCQHTKSPTPAPEGFLCTCLPACLLCTAMHSPSNPCSHSPALVWHSEAWCARAFQQSLYTPYSAREQRLRSLHIMYLFPCLHH